MSGNFRHAKYGSGGTGIDDPQATYSQLEFDNSAASIVNTAGQEVFNATDIQAAQNLAVAAMPPELTPTNWFPDQLFSGGNGFLYGRSSSNFLDFVRIDPATRSRTVVANPFGVSSPQLIRTVVTTSIPGVLLAVIGEGSQTATSMRIWRSSNYGNTWTQVLQLGSGPGGAATGVWLLSDRNFCEGYDGWYIAEYNVNSSRVSGGANDGVTLWKSNDKGVSWFAAQTWNLNGLHQLRHIHCVKKHPTYGIVIGTGDTDAESALIWWDEVGRIGNVAFNSLPSGSKALFGSQRSRVVDLDFVGDYWYWMGDGPSNDVLQAGEVGWFRCPLDLSGVVERLDGQMAGYTLRSAYYSVKLGNGCLAYIEETISTPPSGGFNIGVWVTNASRTRIERAGILKYPSTVTGQVAPVLFQVGSNIYAWISGASFAKGGGTCAFTTSDTKTYNGRRPDVLHPVYWMDPVNGVDSAASDRGFFPSAAVKTFGNILTSSYLPRGGRLVLPAGEFSITEASFALRFSTTGADTTDFFTVDGAGIDATKIGLPSASASAAHITFPLSDVQRIEFKDIHLTTYRNVNGQAVISLAGTQVAQTIQLLRARIGGRDIASQNQPIFGSLITSGSCTLTMYESQIISRPGGGIDLVSFDVDGPITLTAENTVFSGGAHPFRTRRNDVVTLTDCLITDTSVSGGTLESSASGDPSITVVRTRYALAASVPQLVNNSAAVITGRATGCVSINALNPSGFFDATSRVDPRTAPKDPARFVFSPSV
jgi:hypothetical protein